MDIGSGDRMSGGRRCVDCGERVSKWVHVLDEST